MSMLILLLILLLGIVLVVTRWPRQAVSIFLPLALAAVLAAGGALLLHFGAIPRWTAQLWPGVAVEDKLPDSGFTSLGPAEPPSARQPAMKRRKPSRLCRPTQRTNRPNLTVCWLRCDTRWYGRLPVCRAKETVRRFPLRRRLWPKGRTFRLLRSKMFPPNRPPRSRVPNGSGFRRSASRASIG